MTKKAKTPARKGGAKKAAPPMRRKSKRASALPHVDVTAPKRKPIPAQVADGDLHSVTLKARRNGLNSALLADANVAATLAQLHGARADELEAAARALPKASVAKPSRLANFRSSITGRWVTRLFAALNPFTTQREKIRK